MRFFIPFLTNDVLESLKLNSTETKIIEKDIWQYNFPYKNSKYLIYLEAMYFIMYWYNGT